MMAVRFAVARCGERWLHRATLGAQTATMRTDQPELDQYDVWILLLALGAVDYCEPLAMGA